ncbi:MAG: hypothetical protein KGR98_04775 [Verrucomicrobia bacterium]|nr:hypothetical protein [Verrucomicrobiota bacterium]MDE3098487.1 hypothetical protein [Verrucomicrobiota bacterium]
MKAVCLPALAGLVLFAVHARGVTFTEDFATDPLTNGWEEFGETNLFQWNSTNEDLDVTWDSSERNSYFYHALGTTLTRADDFRVEFDIRLKDIQWTNTFELAVGLFNLAYATNAGFSRPLGYTPDLFEYDYFPDSGDAQSDPNVEATMTDDVPGITDFPDFYFVYDDLPMETGTVYHVELDHAAGEAGLTGEVFTNSVFTNSPPYTTMPIVYAGPISDFRLDTLSVMSYSDAGDTQGDSILAHGTVDHFAVRLPPLVRNLTGLSSNGVWQAAFDTYTNEAYTLERSTNLVFWSAAAGPVNGTGGRMTLDDEAPAADHAFYRVRADQQ